MAREPIRETVTVHAPLERCWALSTRVELVQKTLGMNPVGGTTHGFIEAGARVVWSGWKFGLPTRHHTRITRFEPPHTHFVRYDSQEITKEAFFQDSQERGRFAEFHHEHFFREESGGGPVSILNDEVHFRLPFGFLGEFVAARVMAPYIRRLTRRRFAMLKQLAEGDGWRTWMGPGYVEPGYVEPSCVEPSYAEPSHADPASAALGVS